MKTFAGALALGTVVAASPAWAEPEPPAEPCPLAALSLSAGDKAGALGLQAAPYQLALSRLDAAPPEQPAAGGRWPWLAALLQWVLPGAGDAYNGHLLTGLPKAAAFGGITYVELSLQQKDQTLWAIMFGSVLVANTMMAIDAWQEADRLNAEGK